MTNSSDHSERIHEMDVPTGIAVVRAGPSGTGSIEGSRVMTDQSATTLGPPPVDWPTNRRLRVWTDWKVVAALILLSAVPIAVGAARVVELSSGGEVTPDIWRPA
jgi:hypothetical protein